jgi:replicative DNA helicase
MDPADYRAKVPPHNDEAERATLGALLSDPDAVSLAIPYLEPGDFYSAANSRIYEAILNLFKRQLAADLLTVINELRQTAKLDEAGGAPYVAALVNVVPSSANIEYYAQTVQDYSLRRALLRVSAQMAAASHDETRESRLILEEAQQYIFSLNDSRQIYRLRTAEDIIRDTMNDIERVHRSQKDITGIPSGFEALDQLTSGFQNEEFIIIGARPSVGKTALALSMASFISIERNIPTGFFTLEMSDKALMLRILSAEARISSHALRTGFIKSSDFDKIWEAAGRIYKAPLYIVDKPNMKLLDLRAQARRLRAQERVEIIFIDYLSLVTPENLRVQRHEQIAEISRSLKSLARELKIPIVVLSQLTREAEKERPGLASLRESGSIEQDADVVMFLHRKRDSDKNAEERQQDEKEGGKKTELILSKQRNGPTGLIELIFRSQFTKFESYAGERYENP